MQDHSARSIGQQSRRWHGREEIRRNAYREDSLDGAILHEEVAGHLILMAR